MAFVDSPDIVNVEGYTEDTVPVEPTTSWGELSTTSVVCVFIYLSSVVVIELYSCCMYVFILSAYA